ncbi:MAG: RNA polymerase sigma factor [Rubinisphaera brasiliensis]|uniref:RNA polymerase sigma factor n=1 Tax=Rubinisphaera brasiliensis TaxID=119 RepID=UPI00391BEFF1|nr:RNA polymerase sigma factor [bacterium]
MGATAAFSLTPGLSTIASRRLDTHTIMAANVSEVDWVSRLRGPEPERSQALAELQNLLVRGLSKSMANRYGGNAFAEDIAQDALIKILAALDQFENRSRFTTWAMTIATRLAISELRRKHYQDVSLDRFTNADGHQVDFAAREDVLAQTSAEKAEVLTTLQDMIEAKLTNKQQLAVRALLEGWPVEVIAKRMDSNRNAVYKLIHDARQQLKVGFEEAGFPAHDVLAAIS